MEAHRTWRGNYIQGRFLKTIDPNGEIISQNPGNLDEPPVSVPFAYEHVQESIGAAQQAFPSWKRIPAKDRKLAISRYRDLLKSRAATIAALISTEVGKPLWESRLEIDHCIALTDYFLRTGADLQPAVKIDNDEASGSGTVRFLPRGVMAVIIPSGIPAYTAHNHFIPALLLGNTVVMKSPRHAPLVGQALAEMFHEAALPAGVFNLIQGEEETARRLVSHPSVDGVLFTGPYETGIKIKKQILSDYWKILVIDAGGKNGTLIWDDCSYEKALYDAVFSCFVTSGQRATSTSRLLIHEKIFNRFLDDFHRLAKKCSVGYGLNDDKDAPFMGPLVTEDALENYIRYQGIAVREGCEEIMRGKTLERSPRGYYVSPSLHLVKAPNPKSVYEKSEIYAPNVALYSVKDLEEAAEILNLPQHGMVASIYTQNGENYRWLADEVKVGCFHWNHMTVEPTYALPTGGLKKSGNSRPMGSFASLQCSYPVSSLEDSQAKKTAALSPALPRL